MTITNWKHVTELTDEEFKEVEKIIKEEKQKRENAKRAKLFTAFEEAWKAIEAEGIEIWISGNGYTSEEDFSLDFDDIYFS